MPKSLSFAFAGNRMQWWYRGNAVNACSLSRCVVGMMVVVVGLQGRLEVRSSPGTVDGGGPRRRS